MGGSNGDSVSTIFIKEVARATPWGLMVIVVVLIALGFVNYTGKNLIRFAQKNAAETIRQIATDRIISEHLIENRKEMREYFIGKAGEEVKMLLKDPEVKRAIGDIIDHACERIVATPAETTDATPQDRDVMDTIE